MPVSSKIFSFLLGVICYLFAGISQQMEGQISVERIDVNSYEQESSPVLFQQGLAFVSSRKSDAYSKRVDRDDASMSRLYYSEFGKGHFKAAKSLPVAFNPAENLGPFAYNEKANELYVTQSITDQSRSGNSRLGIFKFIYRDLNWTGMRALSINDSEGEYDVAHPAISLDGKTLYFASNMPGGFGGYDLYQAQINADGTWGQPMNLGEKINTSANEGYPSISSLGILYFSSSGHSTAMGMDICSSELDDNGNWKTVEVLPEPVNTNANEISFSMGKSGTVGYFSSDRKVKSGMDIYKAKFEVNFKDCSENEEPYFCYLVEDEKVDLDNQYPYKFAWDLGDGNIKEGKSVEHCYADFGSYEIKMLITDTIKNELIAEISQFELDIVPPILPYIISSDTVEVGEEILFDIGSAPESENSMFYWDFGGEYMIEDLMADHVFTEEGTHEVIFGIRNGKSSTCIKKEIVATRSNNTNSGNDLVMNFSSTSGSSGSENETDNPSMYFVEFHRSITRIPLTDEFFSSITEKITERFVDQDQLYSYTVGEFSELHEAINKNNELKDLGYDEALVHEEETALFDDHVVKRGYFIREEEKKAVNKELATFSEIFFAYNSFEIQKKSFDNLDHIADILSKEKHYKLKIMAHTDIQGNPDYNQKLSEQRAEAVANYLIANGISGDRLISIGYGESQPLENAKDEDNRRVEFEVVTEDVYE